MIVLGLVSDSVTGEGEFTSCSAYTRHMWVEPSVHGETNPFALYAKKKKYRKSGNEQVVLVKRSRIIEENFMVVIVAAEIYASHHTCYNRVAFTIDCVIIST